MLLQEQEVGKDDRITRSHFESAELDARARPYLHATCSIVTSTLAARGAAMSDETC